MLIDRKIEKYVVRDSSTAREVAASISQHHGRVAMVVDAKGHLLGLVTNGDFMRWLSEGSPGGPDVSVMTVANASFHSVREHAASTEIRSLLNDYLYVPVLDERGRLVAVARHRDADEGISFGGRKVASSEPVFVVAEIGNNHNGSLESAFELIDAAAESGADSAKFQMRDMDTLYGGATDGSGAAENLGTQYVLDLLARFQLSRDDLYRCFDRCADKGMVPLCTPFDETSLGHLVSYGMQGIKVASADFTNHPFLKQLGQSGIPLVCSTGMTTEAEIAESVSLLNDVGSEYILLHCNSTYPAPFRDVNLRYMKRLAEIGDCTVGYSGHERDIFVGVAAVAQGARFVEKHFTLDRSLEGSDHKVSLLPGEFRRMVDGIHQVDEALGSDASRRLSQGETMNRVNLAKSIFAACDIEAGDIIEESMLEVRSPGQGLQPNRLNDLIGLRSIRDIKTGSAFYPSDLDGGTETGGRREYDFDRPWGIPVRHHDYTDLLEISAPDFLEFHLSYRDLELNDEEFFPQPLDMGLVVHAPELFAGDHVLDLCSPNEEYRQHSVAEMQRVIEKVRSLRRFFKVEETTGIVTNVGGFSEDRALTDKEKAVRKAKFVQSLGELDTTECEIWPQTMPPYPWHFGGQRFHNLFVEADEIATMCEELGLGLCFDVSHSKLACNTLGFSFSKLTEVVGPYTRHLHVADASGMDGEGLQVGDGEIDFVQFFEQLGKVAPSATFLPEIWQGHENMGEGFWIALDRLSSPS